MYVATAQAPQVNCLFLIMLRAGGDDSHLDPFQHARVSVICLGLTVSLSRDSGTGDYALEAGALVLADQGKTERERSHCFM